VNAPGRAQRGRPEGPPEDDAVDRLGGRGGVVGIAAAGLDQPADVDLRTRHHARGEVEREVHAVELRDGLSQSVPRLL
jgi:hypothetical protein